MSEAPGRPDCPLPQAADAECITLAYGEGGWLTRRFLQERILRRFGNPLLRRMADSALLDPVTGRIAVTTDSYTVSPRFFPGGDLGSLAVYGTVNDLVVSGARPRWLTLALIIEEGFLWGELDRLLDSLQAAAARAQVQIVAGDTKVVPRGEVDGLFINTTGLGEVCATGPTGIETLMPGDVLIVTGPIGQHGAAILCAREGFGFDPLPISDCASLVGPLLPVWETGLPVRSARDATRGGVAAVLHEWSLATGQGMTVRECDLPVTPVVRAVCELMGLDPLFLACEGTCVLAVAPAAVEAVLAVLRAHPQTAHACVIGIVTPPRSTPVRVLRGTGREVPLDEPAGSPLPRIC